MESYNEINQSYSNKSLPNLVQRIIANLHFEAEGIIEFMIECHPIEDVKTIEHPLFLLKVLDIGIKKSNLRIISYALELGMVINSFHLRNAFDSSREVIEFFLILGVDIRNLDSTFCDELLTVQAKKVRFCVNVSWPKIQIQL